VSVDGVEWRELYGLRSLSSGYRKYTIDLDSYIYERGYPVNASAPYILCFPSTIWRYGTEAVATACCMSR
jgi:hypothetical protein